MALGAAARRHTLFLAPPERAAAKRPHPRLRRTLSNFVGEGTKLKHHPLLAGGGGLSAWSLLHAVEKVPDRADEVPSVKLERAAAESPWW